MADKRMTTVQGVEVEQVLQHGNWYTPVDARIKIAHTADPATIRKQPGYHVVSAQIVPMGERYGYHCMVEYPVGSGIIMPGSDFIDMKDPAGLAKAETSAIGRALGLHGIASEDGIASAEEMQCVVEPAPTPTRGEALKQRAAAIGWVGTAYTQLVVEATGKSVEEIKAHGALPADLDAIEKRIRLLEKKASAA